MTNSETGRWAEDQTATFLESKGFRILSRNFRTRFGEIDLVADDADTLVFVEVKYRRDESFSSAEEALTAAKRKKLHKAGRAAALRFGKNKNVRYDFVALIGSADRPEIRHYTNVMEGLDL